MLFLMDWAQKLLTDARCGNPQRVKTTPGDFRIFVERGKELTTKWADNGQIIQATPFLLENLLGDLGLLSTARHD
jgi:hypothetical protein